MKSDGRASQVGHQTAPMAKTKVIPTRAFTSASRSGRATNNIPKLKPIPQKVTACSSEHDHFKLECARRLESVDEINIYLLHGYFHSHKFSKHPLTEDCNLGAEGRVVLLLHLVQL